ncbi:caspase-3-like [Achroia grisella]|uniref:caspase-3-like n=1 Tax=Achroia grisella TaxID=688607 RepID=UPI0027D2DA84|nr:caspase-3-like [Achroia grisella]
MSKYEILEGSQIDAEEAKKIIGEDDDVDLDFVYRKIMIDDVGKQLIVHEKGIHLDYMPSIKKETKEKKKEIRLLSKSARTYELEHYEYKILIIFNHINFRKSEKRVGTEKDVEALSNTFKKFGFSVQKHDDKTVEEIEDIMSRFTKEDHADKYGCIVVAVLTHGDVDGCLEASDRSYNENRLIKYLETTAISKPKILIIQACRGQHSNRAVQVPVYKDNIKTPEFYFLPKQADILVLHSCYPGNPAYRTENGSWFIKTLCEEIDRAYSEDFESIITEVRRKVAINFSIVDYNPETDMLESNKQIPVSTSTFTRKLYLRNFNDDIQTHIDGSYTHASSLHRV